MPRFSYRYYQQDWAGRAEHAKHARDAAAPELKPSRPDVSHFLVAAGTIDADTPEAACEQLFALHNRDDRPLGLAVCSMSMGDIVQIDETAYRCDILGFRPLPQWTAPALAVERGVLRLMEGFMRAPEFADASLRAEAEVLHAALTRAHAALDAARRAAPPTDGLEPRPGRPAPGRPGTMMLSATDPVAASASAGRTPLPVLYREITLGGRPTIVACDARCDKAWGTQLRPRVRLSSDEDDVAYLADDELGTAPEAPATREGGEGKPQRPEDRLNCWCVRQCERATTADTLADIRLPNFSHRCFNLPHRHPPMNAEVDGRAAKTSPSSDMPG